MRGARGEKETSRAACPVRLGSADLPSEHANLARVGEQAAGLQDGSDLAERLQLVALLRREVAKRRRCAVELQLVAGADDVAETLDALERHQVAAVDRVAEEDARVELRDDGLDAG